MSGIQGKNTQPELVLRSVLHREGFRFRLHRRDLPGRPDMTFPRYRAVLFVHGCFWHGHHCHLFRWPSSREAFWREKISRNVERDRKQIAELADLGFRTGIVWECTMKGRSCLALDEIVRACSRWLHSGEQEFDLHGD